MPLTHCALGWSALCRDDICWSHLLFDPDQACHVAGPDLGLKCLQKQGSYRQVCLKFKDFSRTSQDFLIVFKD